MKDVSVLIRATTEDVELWDSAAKRGQLSRSAWARLVLRQAALRHLSWRELPPLELEQVSCVIVEGGQ